MQFTCSKNSTLAWWTNQSFAKRTSHVHVVNGNSPRNSTLLSSQKIKHKFTALSPFSHVHVVLTHLETIKDFTEMVRSIAGRRKRHDCTHNSTLRVHVSRASSQKTELQCFAILRCSNAKDAMTQPLIVSLQSNSREPSRFGHSTFRSCFTGVL